MQTANNIQDAATLLLVYSILSLGFNLTVWAVADKYNIWEKYDYKLSHKLGARCMLCIPFWFAVIYTLPIALSTRNYYLMLSPFITAGITLKIAGKK